MKWQYLKSTLSTRQPWPEASLSVPNRQRSLNGPFQVKLGSSTTVNKKPAEFPLQTARPANGLLDEVLMVELYPPVTN